MMRLMENFAPYYNVPGEDPYSISSNLTLLAPANNIMLEYLKDKTEYPEKDTIIRELLNN